MNIDYRNFEPGKEGTYYKTQDDNEEIKKLNGVIFNKYVKIREQKTIEDPTNVFYSTKFPFTPHFKGYYRGIKYVPALYYILKKDEKGNVTFELVELKGYKFEIATGELYNSYDNKIGGKKAMTKIYAINGKQLDNPIGIQLHIMFLVSLYPYFNWRFFFENSRPGGCVSVDHLLGPGSSRRCHPNLLEVVSSGENTARTGHFNTKNSAESNEKHSETNSKSVSIKRNGVDVKDDNGDIIEYKNAKECAEAIYKGKETGKKYEKKIKYLSKRINEYIKGDIKSVSGYTEYTFVRGQSYIKSQEDLYITKWRLDRVNNKYVIEKYIVKEIWTYYEDLDEEHKKEIKDFFKDNKIPIAISDCGRVMNHFGEKSYGNCDKADKKRRYNNHAIYIIMWYWFASIEKIKELQNGIQSGSKLCHCDGDLKHPLVKRQSENGEENSNIWGTFYLGGDVSNGKDNSANQLRKAQENKKGHFKAFKVEDGKPISDKIFVSTKDFNNWASNNGITEKFNNITAILKGYRLTDQGLTFKPAYDTTETFIEVKKNI
jgi:hypothetical protein